MKPSDAAAPDVFISYARKNRPVAEQLADGLSAGGLQVWWDSDLTAGSVFSAVIEAKLLGAAVVIVMWSADSVRSSFVLDESSRALKHDKLLPVRIEDIELPLGFGQLHTLDLLDWDGDTGDDAFEKLLLEVRQRRQRAPRGLLATPAPPPR
ncbi:MAG: toll/interleukin-1 receptor domain-containing protein, partial [Burkholderiales bacterium]|nr:toll/interleukin-1 receptor domain-containing protein [Burkholderiales bacterium]